MVKKEEETILIIASAFANQDLELTKSQIKICQNLNHLELIQNYGLNDVQSNVVINWCNRCLKKCDNDC